MNIGEMCSRGVVYAPASASLDSVALLMKERNVGAVVITKSTTEPSVVGIITDRDIVRAQLEHVTSLARLRVAAVMSRDLLVLRTDEPLERAIEMMRARGVRRAPVVTPTGVLFGFVSTDDLIAELARQLDVLAAGMLSNRPTQRLG